MRREQTIKPRGFTGLEVLRMQFPLVQGACTTIKSQGRTFQRMNANCRTSSPGSRTNTAGKPGSYHVQCSRVTTLEGLALLDSAENQITCDDAIENVMQNLRTNHNQQHNLLSRSARACVQNSGLPSVVVAAWNCVTLRDTHRGHLPDAQASDTLQFADAVFFCETKLCATDSLDSTALTTGTTAKAVVAHQPAKSCTSRGCMLQISSTVACRSAATTCPTVQIITVQATIQKGDMAIADRWRAQSTWPQHRSPDTAPPTDTATSNG